MFTVRLAVIAGIAGILTPSLAFAQQQAHAGNAAAPTLAEQVNNGATLAVRLGYNEYAFSHPASLYPQSNRAAGTI